MGLAPPRKTRYPRLHPPREVCLRNFYVCA
jgi:hypothetical protein